MTTHLDYPIVLRPLGKDDGGGWIAIVPDLPGCMSDGESADEALAHVRDAIAEWMDASQALGRTAPRPDDFLESSFAKEIPENIREQAEAHARDMSSERDGPQDQNVVHAIIAEWARAAVRKVRL